MKKILTAISILILMTFALSSCYVMNHTVGEGAKGNTEVVQRQWYVLWGLVPLNDVSTVSMAGGAEDYNIEVKQSFIDAIIGAFTGAVTIAPRTVTVTK